MPNHRRERGLEGWVEVLVIEDVFSVAGAVLAVPHLDPDTIARPAAGLDALIEGKRDAVERRQVDLQRSRTRLRDGTGRWSWVAALSPPAHPNPRLDLPGSRLHIRTEDAHALGFSPPPGLTVAALVERLRAGDRVTVDYHVRPLIGPGWIGGRRKVDVRVADQLLPRRSPAHIAIERVVVAALGLPGASDLDNNDILGGHGPITLARDGLVYAVDWSRYPIYGWPDSGSDRIRLGTVDALLSPPESGPLRSGD